MKLLPVREMDMIILPITQPITDDKSQPVHFSIHFQALKYALQLVFPKFGQFYGK